MLIGNTYITGWEIYNTAEATKMSLPESGSCCDGFDAAGVAAAKCSVAANRIFAACHHGDGASLFPTMNRMSLITSPGYLAGLMNKAHDNTVPDYHVSLDVNIIVQADRNSSGSRRHGECLEQRKETANISSGATGLVAASHPGGYSCSSRNHQHLPEGRGVGVWPPGGWGTANRFKTGHWGDHRLWRGVEHSATREPGPGAWGFGKTGHLSKGLHRIERSPYRGADRSRLPGARLRFTNRGPFWRRRGCLNRKIHRRQLCPKLCPLLATTVPHH